MLLVLLLAGFCMVPLLVVAMLLDVIKPFQGWVKYWQSVEAAEYARRGRLTPSN